MPDAPGASRAARSASAPVGVYPRAAAVEALTDDLVAYQASKGAIRVPLDAPLPAERVRLRTRGRLGQMASASHR